MEHLIIELGKYLNILLIAIYTFLGMRCFLEKGKIKKHRVILMTLVFFIIHINCYMQLYLYSYDERLIIFYAAQTAIYLLIFFVYKKCYRRISELLFNNMMLLIMIGVVILSRIRLEAAIQQFIIAVAVLGISTAVLMIISKFELWNKLGILYLIGGLLILVLLLFIGEESGGATNWLFIGSIRIQPSEFVKLLFVFGIASFLGKCSADIKKLVLITVIAASYVLILVFEKDLGAALIFFITYVLILYASTGRLFLLLSGFCAGLAASVAAYFIFPHVQTRVQVFLDPIETYNSGGYQVAQSLFAIGTGSWFGLGTGQGIPEKIPVAESDFIFSAITEEMGAVFSICIIIIYLTGFMLFIRISLKFKDKFYRLLGLGFACLYMFQTFLNIGGVIKMIPSTGVTLPLISAGGSSLTSTLVMFAVFQGMYSKSENIEIEQKKEIDQKTNSRLILFMTYAICILFTTVIVYLSFYITIKSKTFLLSDLNIRKDILASRNLRGEIRAADGEILAETIIDYNGKEKRNYPYGAVYSHIVGRNTNGKTGIEGAADSELSSSNINMMEKVINDLYDRKYPGDIVYSTLNTKLQETAYEALGENKGAVVILEPSTGKVLSMVSKPDYDPNTAHEEWNTLIGDKDSARLLNRATLGLYPPGSTFKLITLLEYIRENSDYKKFKYECNSTERQNEVTIHCANGISHGQENLKKAFANSCNSAFAKLGCTLNADRLKSLADDFMYNEVLPGTFGSATSSMIFSSKSNTHDMPQTVIGAGKTQITPLHNAMIAAAVANDGIAMVPYVIAMIKNANGSIIKENKPSVYKTIINTEEARLLQDYMQYVVEEGTGSRLNDIGVMVAGKTGTAIYDSDKSAHAWFIGFAPVENPEIAISVIVESIGSGSKYAVPIAEQIIRKYMEMKK